MAHKLNHAPKKPDIKGHHFECRGKREGRTSLMFDGNLSKQINVNVRITSTA